MSDERRRQVLQLAMNGDGRTCSIVDENGVAVADGVLRPVPGAVDLISEGQAGMPLQFGFYFDGTVV